MVAITACQSGPRRAWTWASVAVLACTVLTTRAENEYLVGVGKADITGPVADVNLMGYANPTQIAGGILTRQYARALIVAEARDPSARFAFVNLDACMGSQAVTRGVISALKARYGPLYSDSNVALSGTHTHSGPAGFLQYLVYSLTALGWVSQTYDALVEGVVRAVERAHEDLRPGWLSAGGGELLGANINRSPTAYRANPQWERDLYAHDIDKTLTLLRVEQEEESGRATVGAFSWFPVHGTSVNNTNTLVNGDNKGLASQIMERELLRRAERGGAPVPRKPNAPPSPLPPTPVVSAFCQANVGDTSPNTRGAWCGDTREPCDAVHSTCGGRVQECRGRGSSWPDDLASCHDVAAAQAGKALELLDGGGDGLASVSGAVQHRHKFLDMRDLEVAASNHTRAGRTCPAAMGFAFAAGTTDGPGAFDFTQGDTNGTAFWRAVRAFLHAPTAEQEACHSPKPILLDVGHMRTPYDWAPSIVEISILRAGSFAILCVPAELTTMAGRRLRRAVSDVVGRAWGPDLQIVIAGLTNTYASYVTTFEEYAQQRYEGGFTLFGPNTLDAYIQEFTTLARAMVDGTETPPGPAPPDLVPDQWSLLPPVVVDAPGWGTPFGGVLEDVQPQVVRGSGVARALFQSACPRNGLRTESSFLTVERRAPGSDDWVAAATDDAWETRFRWTRPETLSPTSHAEVEWVVPADAEPGVYRLGHAGDYKPLFGGVQPFQGYSSEFQVVPGPDETKGQASSGHWWQSVVNSIYGVFSWRG